MTKKPLILVTNDDGIGSAGIKAAYDAVAGMSDAWVVAPRDEYSSCGHSITLSRPLFCSQRSEKWFEVSGTPVDAVFVACSHILPRLPDLVISGINNGRNIGRDTFYSGTVAAAREAAFRGIPAVAVSIKRGENLEAAVDVIRTLLPAVLKLAKSVRRHRANDKAILLNVNIPSGKPRGFKVTRLGRRMYNDRVIKRLSPNKTPYYWIDGGPVQVVPGRGTDGAALADGFVSITPLGLDQTDLEMVALLSKELSKLRGPHGTERKERRSDQVSYKRRSGLSEEGNNL